MRAPTLKTPRHCAHVIVPDPAARGDAVRGTADRDGRKGDSACHEAHLRRDLLRQALEEAKEQGLVDRHEYKRLADELELSAGQARTR